MIDNLKKLKILNLSSNKIETIQGLDQLINLEQLNLSSNKIKKINKNSLSSQYNLTKLILSYNYIQDISGLNMKYFQSNNDSKLRYLDLKCNQISDISQLQHLQHLKSLQNLMIEDDNDKNHDQTHINNPICKQKKYKYMIADTLPKLKWLNMKLFDSNSFASKIKIIIKSPKQSIKPNRRQKKKINTNKNSKHKNKTKRKQKRIAKYTMNESISSSQYDSSSSYSSSSSSSTSSNSGSHQKLIILRKSCQNRATGKTQGHRTTIDITTTSNSSAPTPTATATR